MVNKRENKFPPLFKPFRYSKGVESLNDGRWHPTETQAFAIKTWRNGACILTRQHYVEFQKEYPISNVYHLYKVIKAEVATISPFPGRVVWAITRFQPKNWQVTFWAIPQQVVDELQVSFKFIVPESLLLFLSVEDESISSFGSDAERVFVYRAKGGFVSTKSDGLVVNTEHFARMVNRFDLVSNVSEYSEEAMTQLLVKRLAGLPFRYLPGLILSKNAQPTSFLQVMQRNKGPLIASVAVLGAYAAGISWYFSLQNGQLDSELTEKRSEMSKLLDEESRATAMSSQVLAIQTLEASYPGIDGVLKELANLPEIDLTISNIEIVGDTVTLRGVSSSSTDIFSALSSGRVFSSVEFLGPISEDRRSGQEKFALSFVYNPAGVQQ